MLSISFTAVLRGLGLQFAGRGDERHEREVREHHVFRAQLQAHLADGFEKRQRLDVTNCAANFNDNNIDVNGDFAESGFDFVGHVRNYLNSPAEIVAPTLLGDDRFVDATSGPGMVAREMRGGESLIVAEVKIRFWRRRRWVQKLHRAGRATWCRDQRSGMDRTSGG